MPRRAPAAALPGAVGIIGLGLIGASLCGALRRGIPGVHLAGVARRPAVVRRTLDDGLCDVAGVDAGVVRGCDVVVLCIPVDAMPHWMALLARAAPEVLVTDAGSTKGWLCAQAQELLPGRFCGGHPMAGREVSGYEAADPGLFDGATWVLTPPAPVATTMRRFRPWRNAVEAIGARVEVMDPADHDIAVALVSHMPFVVSSALMRAASADPAWTDAGRLAATGFLDMVRIAGGDPAMYAAITATNGAAMARALRGLARELEAFTGADEADALREYFAAAREARAVWLEQRGLEGPGRR